MRLHAPAPRPTPAPWPPPARPSPAANRLGNPLHDVERGRHRGTVVGQEQSGPRCHLLGLMEGFPCRTTTKRWATLAHRYPRASTIQKATDPVNRIVEGASQLAEDARKTGERYIEEGRRRLPEAEQYYRQGQEAVSAQVRESAACGDAHSRGRGLLPRLPNPRRRWGAPKRSLRRTAVRSSTARERSPATWHAAGPSREG